MSCSSPLHVLKFGSSVLRHEDDLARIVHELYAHLRRGARVLAVVSAVGDTTDELARRAADLDAEDDSAHTAALLATGEDAASAQLALACERAGIPVQRFDAARAGLVSAGPLCDSTPTGLDVAAIEAAFEEAPVVILPGFVGRAACGRTSVFGRGGSDLTALFLADRLRADLCRLVKDVDGLYESDPAAAGPRPRKFATLPWRLAEELGGCVVQAKAVHYARERRLGFELGALGSPSPTRIDGSPMSFCDDGEVRAALRVGLCGLGTVGGGVLARLRAQPERFEVVGALVRDSDAYISAGEDPALFAKSTDELLERGCDALVELIGGVPAAFEVARHALECGVDVITANKALVAERGAELHALAEVHGARLSFSASVGGAVPMLEAARRARGRGELEGFEAVLNGTTNYLLSLCAGGVPFEAALLDAQRRGFAEADPSLDLDGTDAVQKAALLARAAWGSEIALETVEHKGLEDLDALAPARRKRAGQVVRLVASATRVGETVRLNVRPMCLDLSHPLAQVDGVQNRARFRFASGGLIDVHGAGAGRWPTTEAVLADLFERCSATCPPPVHDSAALRAGELLA